MGCLVCGGSGRNLVAALTLIFEAIITRIMPVIAIIQKEMFQLMSPFSSSIHKVAPMKDSITPNVTKYLILYFFSELEIITLFSNPLFYHP